MKILALDPGTFETGLVIINEEYELLKKEIVINALLLDRIKTLEYDRVIIEMVASYGMPVGKTTFNTVLTIGRIYQEAKRLKKMPTLITRQAVKKVLCFSMKAKDSNVNQAVKDLYEPTGGGADPYKGTKKQSGPLYGMKSHMWAALALGIAFFRGAEHYDYV